MLAFGQYYLPMLCDCFQRPSRGVSQHTHLKKTPVNPIVLFCIVLYCSCEAMLTFACGSSGSVNISRATHLFRNLYSVIDYLISNEAHNLSKTTTLNNSFVFVHFVIHEVLAFGQYCLPMLCDCFKDTGHYWYCQ